MLILALFHWHKKLPYQLLRAEHGFFTFTRNQHVQFVVFVFKFAGLAAAVLHGALATNSNLGTRFFLHIFLSDATGTNDQANEVVIRVLFHGNVHLFELAA